MNEVWDGKQERRKEERRKPVSKPWDGWVKAAGGKSIDLRDALPLRVGDWKVLKKSNISMKDLSGFIRDLDLEKLQQLVAHVANKVQPTKPEDLDSLTILELVSVVNGMLEAENRDVDRPT